MNVEVCIEGHVALAISMSGRKGYFHGDAAAVAKPVIL
jgi:hypothetical protein